MRGLRDSQKQPIFKSIYKEGVQGRTSYELDGTSIFFQRNIQAADANNNLMIAGQWDQLVWAMRQDMTFKILTEATIQDNAGNTMYNLAQQDMVALRLVMRLGWALPNPAALINENKSTRFPFGVLVA
jgi:HK97 family phage major capsid protein